MNKKQTQGARVWIDLWISRIGSVIVWFFFAFWLLIALVGVAELLDLKKKESLDYFMPLICFGIALLHFFLIRSFRKTKALIRDFRMFSSVFSKSSTKSIRDIEEALHADPEWIRNRLIEMCSRGYFHGHFDFSEQRIILSASGPSVIQCPGCGATNAVSKNGDCCIYCGSPLVYSCSREDN